MKLAVLADDDGTIVAIAECRMSPTGQVGTFNEEIELRAEIKRSGIDRLKGREPSGEQDPGTWISSVIVDMPNGLEGLDLSRVHDSKVLDRSGPAPILIDKAT